MKPMLILCFFLFGVSLASKKRQSCIKSLKGKLCLKLSLKNFDHCMANTIKVFESSVGLCLEGTVFCVRKPRVCSGC